MWALLHVYTRVITCLYYARRGSRPPVKLTASQLSAQRGRHFVIAQPPCVRSQKFRRFVSHGTTNIVVQTRRTHVPICPITSANFFEPQETALTKTRFELACARCSAAGSGNPEGVEVQHDNNIPICQDLPTGARAMLSGTTVEGMFLEAGYYRTSAESREILECHRSKACVGGDDATDYCAIGYKGPCKCYRSSCLHLQSPTAPFQEVHTVTYNVSKICG